MNYIDLTHTFVNNMPVIAGDPPTILKQITTIGKNGYVDHSLTTVMHVGTHIDAPLHMIEGGKYIDEMPIDHFTGKGVIINAYKRPVIDVDLLHGIEIPVKSIVLLYTGMSEIYGTPQYFSEYPRVTQAFAKEIVKRGVNIVGMDMLSPDTEESYPVHKNIIIRRRSHYRKSH